MRFGPEGMELSETGAATIEAEVSRQIAEVLGIPTTDLDLHCDLVEEYGIDSLELMEIGTRIENALRVRIGLDDLQSAATPADLIRHLHELTAS